MQTRQTSSKRKAKTARVSIRLDLELLEQLQRIARRRDDSLSRVMRGAAIREIAFDKHREAA
jgi:predicted transcriptional regulator